MSFTDLVDHKQQTTCLTKGMCYHMLVCYMCIFCTSNAMQIVYLSVLSLSLSLFPAHMGAIVT